MKNNGELLFSCWGDDKKSCAAAFTSKAGAVMLIIFILFLAIMREAEARRPKRDTWFPDGDVSCSVKNSDVNLGVFSSLKDQRIEAPGTFGVECSSRAYPPHSETMVQAAYCLSVNNGVGNRGELLGVSPGNDGVNMPVHFYSRVNNSTNGSLIEGKNSLFYTGDAAGGDRGKRPSGGKNDPVEGDIMHPVSMNSDFLARAEVRFGGSYPSGVYSGTFFLDMYYGTLQQPETGGGYTPYVNPCRSWSNFVSRRVVTIELTVKASCNVEVLKPIDFGVQPFLGRGLRQWGQISVDCDKGTKYSVGLSEGLHAEGGQRFMQGSKGKIAYNLFKDANYSSRWGDNWGKDTDNGNIGRPRGTVKDVYAEVPPQDTPAPGAYKDTVIVTVRID